MEKINKMWNSIKTGIITWIFAYFFYYIVAILANDIASYNEQIMKMANGMNFFIQAAVSGIAYMVIEIIILDFMRRIIKSVETDKVKEVVKNMILTILIMVLEFGILLFVNIEDIISEEIFSIMIGILIIKGIAFSIKQSVDEYKINKKLIELNTLKEEK